MDLLNDFKVKYNDLAFFIIFSIKDLYISSWSFNYCDNNTIYVLV